jgi:hypothetical protein
MNQLLRVSSMQESAETILEEGQVHETGRTPRAQGHPSEGGATS